MEQQNNKWKAKVYYLGSEKLLSSRVLLVSAEVLFQMSKSSKCQSPFVNIKIK